MTLRQQNELASLSKRALWGYFWSPERQRRRYRQKQIRRRQSVALTSGIPANILEHLGFAIRRVILVANNSECGPSKQMLASIADADLIVQYNSCYHYKSFKELNCRKLIVFRGDGYSGSSFGFSRKVKTFSHLNGEPRAEGVSILFVDNIPHFGKAPRGLTRVLREPGTCAFLDTSEAIFETYPMPQGAEGAGPSTGFATLNLFLRAREGLRHEAGREFEIVLCGFRDAPNSQLWGGHNWAYERDFVSGLAGQVIMVS